MRHKLRIIAVMVGAATVIGASAKDALSDDLTVEASIAAALTRNYFLTLNAPAGTTNIETNPAYKEAAAVPAPAGVAASAAAAEWPSYNRTLASERFSPLSQINTKNVGKVKVLCTYDIGQFTAFEAGLLMVNDALIGATEFDTFSLNPATCAANWRKHDPYPASIIPVNRGVAYATEIAVSTDGGQTWAEAHFLDPVQRHAWRRWRFDWLTPREPGQYTLLARAKDASGGLQPNEHDWNYGSYVINHLLPIEVLVEDPVRPER